MHRTASIRCARCASVRTVRVDSTARCVASRPMERAARSAPARWARHRAECVASVGPHPEHGTQRCGRERSPSRARHRPPVAHLCQGETLGVADPVKEKCRSVGPLCPPRASSGWHRQWSLSARTSGAVHGKWRPLPRAPWRASRAAGECPASPPSAPDAQQRARCGGRPSRARARRRAGASAVAVLLVLLAVRLAGPGGRWTATPPGFRRSWQRRHRSAATTGENTHGSAEAPDHSRCD